MNSARSAKFSLQLYPNLFLGAFKFIGFIFLLILLLMHHSLVKYLLRDEDKRLRYYLRSIQLSAKLSLRLLNISVDSPEKDSELSGLLVSNHQSYIDVLVLFSRFPSLFVTSKEIKETFFLGDICKLAGCFFVERRKHKHSPGTKIEEINLMKTRTSSGFNVFLFPEGTSTDGSRILPFKGTFFQLATDLELDIHPLCLKYSGESRNHVPWYGDMGFLSHLFNLCLQDKISAHLTILPGFKAQEKMLAAKVAQQLIQEAYDKH